MPLPTRGGTQLYIKKKKKHKLFLTTRLFQPAEQPSSYTEEHGVHRSLSGHNTTRLSVQNAFMIHLQDKYICIYV